MKKNYLLSGLLAMAMTGMALISCTDTDEPEPEPEPGSSVSVQEIKAIPVIAIAKRPDKR